MCSTVLDRVRNFLPQLADGNAALSQQPQEMLDIENVGEDQEQYIEMVRLLTFRNYIYSFSRFLESWAGSFRVPQTWDRRRVGLGFW